MEENKKEEKKKLNIKERWKDKRERAKIELMLYGIFFLAIIIFARISSSFSDSNIPKDNDIKSFINDITDNYQYDIDITIDNNNYKYYRRYRQTILHHKPGQTHYKKYFHKSWREGVRHRAKRLFLGLPRERHYNSFYTPKNV